MGPTSPGSGNDSKTPMLARPVLKKPTNAEEPTPKASQAKAAEERFLLRVDGQTKRSFASLDDAMTAGKQIKKAYPIVAVTVIDTADGSTHPI